MMRASVSVTERPTRTIKGLRALMTKRVGVALRLQRLNNMGPLVKRAGTVYALGNRPPKMASTAREQDLRVPALPKSTAPPQKTPGIP